MKSIILTTLLTGIVAVTALVPESDDFSTTKTAATSISTSTSGEVLLAQTPGGERRRVRRRTRRRVNRRHERRENIFFTPITALWA